MDIQNLIKLAHQADLEGNYKVADKLTERAIREAAGFGGRTGTFGRPRPGGSGFGGFGGGRGRGGGGGRSGGGGGFFGAGGPDFSQNADGANLSGGNNSTTGAKPGANSSGRNNSGSGGPGGGGGGAKVENTSTVKEPGRVTLLRNKKNNPKTPLTPEEEIILEKADKKNAADRERRKNKAGGGGGGGGGRGGDNDSSIQQDNSTTGAPGGPGGTLNQTQNGRYRTRDIGGDVVGMGTMGSLALATVPTAIVAALGAYGYTMLNGRVVDQKTGQPVPPQNLPPQVQNLMSGGAKANPLALRTQANQMGNAQSAQMFIEDRRRNPAFKTAQDFWVAATQAGQNPSMVNQIVALAKAEGYPDKTPYTN